MPYFMLTNRKLSNGEPGEHCAVEMAHYIAKDSAATKLTQFSSWEKVPDKEFRKRLTDVAASFPDIPDDDNESQKHVSLFVHGYNVGWKVAVARYADIYKRLYSGPKSLGALVLYTWPSNGSAAGYLPDREDARASAPLLADALVTLYDYCNALPSVNPPSNAKPRFRSSHTAWAIS